MGSNLGCPEEIRKGKEGASFRHDKAQKVMEKNKTENHTEKNKEKPLRIKEMVHKIFDMRYGNNRGKFRAAVLAIGGEPLNNPDSPIYHGVANYLLSKVGGGIIDDGHFRVTIGADSKEMVEEIKSKLESKLKER